MSRPRRHLSGSPDFAPRRWLGASSWLAQRHHFEEHERSRAWLPQTARGFRPRSSPATRSNLHHIEIHQRESAFSYPHSATQLEAYPATPPPLPPTARGSLDPRNPASYPSSALQRLLVS